MTCPLSCQKAYNAKRRFSLLTACISIDSIISNFNRVFILAINLPLSLLSRSAKAEVIMFDLVCRWWGSFSLCLSPDFAIGVYFHGRNVYFAMKCFSYCTYLWLCRCTTDCSLIVFKLYGGRENEHLSRPTQDAPLPSTILGPSTFLQRGKTCCVSAQIAMFL